MQHHLKLIKLVRITMSTLDKILTFCFYYYIQAIREGKSLKELEIKHEREQAVLESMFETEEAEQSAEIIKKINEEHKDAVREAHRDLFDQVGIYF